MGKGILNRGAKIHKDKTKYNRKTERGNMSMFYCHSCDHLVDSDEVLFIVDEVTKIWTCENCLEADSDINSEKVLELFNTARTKADFLAIHDYLEIAKK